MTYLAAWTHVVLRLLLLRLLYFSKSELLRWASCREELNEEKNGCPYFPAAVSSHWGAVGGVVWSVLEGMYNF